jgi:hypothetical protein
MDSARQFCKLLTRRRKAYKQVREKALGSNWERIERPWGKARRGFINLFRSNWERIERC